MLVIERILEIFMAIGALPALLVVVPLEEIFGVDIAGTWFSGAIAFLFGVLISGAFIFGLIEILL